jgi:hypothetical protein
VISGLIARYRSVVGFPRVAWAFLVKAFFNRNFAQIVVEFLTEVAVLVLVFPTLDTIIERGSSKVTGPIVYGSIATTVGCLFVAGIISMHLKE